MTCELYMDLYIKVLFHYLIRKKDIDPNRIMIILGQILVTR